MTSTTIQQQLDTELRLPSFFKDYPSLAASLKKLAFVHPTYLQAEVLKIQSDTENLVICAPEGHGKKVGSLLYALKKLVNCEDGHLVVLVHSKQSSFSIQHILAGLTHLPCFNLYQKKPTVEQAKEKLLIVGTPLQTQQLQKQIKDKVQYCIAMEFDYLMSFGFGQSLHRIFEGSNSVKILVMRTQCTQLPAFKEKYLKKSLNVTIQEEKDEADKTEAQVSHFFNVGQPIYKNIALYMILKFSLIHPKILIICQSQREVYRTALFLERCRIRNVGIYNHDNPISVKFYALSIWLAGTNNILISTIDVLKDINSNLFSEQTKQAFKKNKLELSNLSTIITMNLSFMKKQLNLLFDFFQGKVRLVNLIDNKENQKQTLEKLLSYEKQTYETVRIKEFPISRQEMEAFQYRISDVMDNIAGKRPDWYAELDLKKKILKSKDMGKYFETHAEEKTLLQKKIQQLTKKINQGRIELSDIVPEYLLPQFIRETYMEKVREMEKEHFKSLRPTKTEKMEVEENKQEEPKKKETVDTKIGRALASLNVDEQNPETTDPSRLKILSGRKRWKLLHGFKLKKRNRRLERKGIFD